jgi:hypothetical protein
MSAEESQAIINVTEDGGVTKKILEEGQGDAPSNGQEVHGMKAS